MNNLCVFICQWLSLRFEWVISEGLIFDSLAPWKKGKKHFFLSFLANLGDSYQPYIHYLLLKKIWVINNELLDDFPSKGSTPDNFLGVLHIDFTQCLHNHFTQFLHRDLTHIYLMISIDLSIEFLMDNDIEYDRHHFYMWMTTL
jgi:hypothetical protein